MCIGTKGHYAMSMHQKHKKILFIAAVKGSSRAAGQDFGCALLILIEKAKLFKINCICVISVIPLFT